MDSLFYLTRGTFSDIYAAKEETAIHRKQTDHKKQNCR